MNNPTTTGCECDLLDGHYRLITARIADAARSAQTQPMSPFIYNGRELVGFAQRLDLYILEARVRALLDTRAEILNAMAFCPDGCGHQGWLVGAFTDPEAPEDASELEDGPWQEAGRYRD
jgi:hypothetical protein